MITIVSGGETGVDRGALDAALLAKVPCGGWCPEGRRADDGPIDDKYPLQVLAGSGYRAQTRQNVVDSDGTVIIYFEQIYLGGGTEQTLLECVTEKRPYLLIDGSEISESRTAQRIEEFVRKNRIQKLNVAGPKGRSLPQAHTYTQNAITQFLEAAKYEYEESNMQIPFFKHLLQGQRFLLAGAGGGFDIANGIPLYLYLRSLGKEVALANYSFSELGFTDNEEIAPGAYRVTQQSRDVRYFPEKFLVDWLAQRGETPQMFAFSNRLGVQPLRAAYQVLLERLQFDTLVLVDGGTDSLIFGDEPGLGTIVEDACSMIAANGLGIERSYLLATAFGVDHFHGVSHHAYLENVAALMQEGAYLGAYSVTKEMPEGQAFLDFVEYSNQRTNRPSIVANSVASSLRGEFGNSHAVQRTHDQELFINPLMGLQWAFDLKAVVDRMQFAPDFETTETLDEIAKRLMLFKAKTHKRVRKNIPL